MPAGAASDTLVTTDRFVTHLSTVPATAGQTVGLFVREIALASTLRGKLSLVSSLFSSQTDHASELPAAAC